MQMVKEEKMASITVEKHLNLMNNFVELPEAVGRVFFWILRWRFAFHFPRLLNSQTLCLDNKHLRNCFLETEIVCTWK